MLHDAALSVVVGYCDHCVREIVACTTASGGGGIGEITEALIMPNNKIKRINENQIGISSVSWRVPLQIDYLLDAVTQMLCQ